MTPTATLSAGRIRSAVERTIRHHRLLEPGDRVLVAVSGGPDSVCLLHLLHRLTTRWRLALHVAHLNHGLRGAEAARDAAFVASLAERLGLPASIETADVDIRALAQRRNSPGRLSLEAAAREVRYRFLERVASEVGSRRIALGHTANDQAETVLMRLLRGAGREGLDGIPIIRPLAQDVHLVRPLLGVTRTHILTYLDAHRLTWCEDSTNRVQATFRNRIRHALLPVLLEHNPNLIETLGREATILGDEDALLDQLARAALATVALTPPSPWKGEGEGRGIELDAHALSRLPRALGRRAVRLAAAEGAQATLTFRQVEAILDLASGRSSSSPASCVGRLSLPHGVIAERAGTIVRLGHPTLPMFPVGPSEAEGHQQKPAPQPHVLTVPGESWLPDWGVRVRATIVEGGQDGGLTRDGGSGMMATMFDADRLPLPLTIRGRQPGDWFCPTGMAGRRKTLQDFFVDVKVPRQVRDQVPLLVSPAGVVWVVGRRLDVRFLANERSRRILTLEVRRGDRPINPTGGPTGGPTSTKT